MESTLSCFYFVSACVLVRLENVQQRSRIKNKPNTIRTQHALKTSEDFANFFSHLGSPLT